MTVIRVASLTLLSLAFVARFPALGQSVVSTHSGVVYFFSGAVFIGDEQLEQKFGRFPEIGEGRQLRTAQGRAEVLLTPGVFLRLGENSTVRMLSNKLADTRIELLEGSAIVESRPESNAAGKDTAATLIHKNWQARVPQESVFRIDTAPPQLRVYKGEVKIATEGQPETVAVKPGEILPFAAVLLTDHSTVPEGDDFKTWAMARSQAIASDNVTAAGIVDDPSKFDTTVDLGGLGYGGYTYFPPAGLSSIGLAYPYGLSFWSPYQSMLTSLYIPAYFYGAVYGPVHSGWPVGVGVRSYPGSYRGTYPGPIGIRLPIGVGVNSTTPRTPYPSVPRQLPHAPAPSVAPHPVGVHPVGVHPAVHR